ncbi:hypothetical protein OH807_38595 [Kitasatospora sp. NBC_01560]|uniref:hypothetical protein n=1 Tax=Kitasatospora sp. NBC_01560 TaxID=2975965 RepID=UPI00386D497D
MTATNDAPDPVAAAEERWQRLQGRFEAVGVRMRTETGSALAAMDACLDGLEAVRRHLADHPGLPRTSSASVAGPAPARR